MAGELTDGQGAADVEGLGVAEVGELGGGAGDGGVEVEGVGEVELAVDLHGAGEGGVLGVDVEPAPVRSSAALLLGGVGVVTGEGLGDQVVELGPGAGVRDVGERPVDLERTGLGQDEGVLGDPPGPPDGDLAVEDALPQPGEAVAQLEGGADVGLAGVGGHAEGGGVLHERELRDQRGAGAGDGQAAVAGDADRVVAGPAVGGGVVGVDGVADRPGDGELELADLDLADLVIRSPQRGEDGGGVAEVAVVALLLEVGAGHGSIAAPGTDSHGLESGVVHRGGGHGLVTTFRLNRGGFVARACGPRTSTTAGRHPVVEVRGALATSHETTTAAGFRGSLRSHLNHRTWLASLAPQPPHVAPSLDLNHRRLRPPPGQRRTRTRVGSRREEGADWVRRSMLSSRPTASMPANIELPP